VSAWWTGVPAAEVELDCGGARHRVRWDRGRLAALDHPELEGERALAALAGEPRPCIELLDAWHRHADDVRVLVLGSRGASDRLVIDLDALTGHRPVRRPGGPAVPSPTPWRLGPRASRRRHAEVELSWLLSVGGGLGDRLAATVAAAWARRFRAGTARVTGPRAPRAQLEAALHGRVLAALRTWLGEAELDAGVTMIPGTQPPSLERVGGRVEARLPFSWLVDVWARGLATVAGRFCLAAETGDGRTWRLTTVAPDLGATGVLMLVLPEVL